MKAGYSKICINPPYDSLIVGYYEERRTKGILDDIYVTATAFDDGETRAVIIALDLCEFEQKYYDVFKSEISKACKISPDAIFINCSHTHTGPLIGKDLASDKRSDEKYDNFLISCVRDAAIYAFDDLKDARIESAKTVAKNVSFVRRFRMKDGSVATNPGVNNPNIDYALGEPNEDLKVVKIIREGADDIIIVNFGTHPDSVGGEYISGDYMGFVNSILERAIPNCKSMFLLAPQGDVNHVNVHPTKGEQAISEIDFDGVPRSIRHAEHMGRVIAGAALSVVSITEPVCADKISFASARIDLPSHKENDRISEARKVHELYAAGRANELPYTEMELTTVVAEAERILNLENGPDSFPFYLSAIKIGDMVFAGFGGEVFTEIGAQICEKSPFDTTILCCLTNSEGGYVPTTKAYSEGGYEARSSAFAPGSAEILVEEMTKFLKKL